MDVGLSWRVSPGETVPEGVFWFLFQWVSGSVLQRMGRVNISSAPKERRLASGAMVGELFKKESFPSG